MKKNLKPTSLLKGKRRHGFRRRMKSKGGQKVLHRRRLKGRHQLIP